MEVESMSKRHRVVWYAIALLLVRAPMALFAEPAGQLGFLVGNWTGTGAGDPGQGVGSFSFSSDLQGRVLVRHAHTEYPATPQRPATVHDDLMVVYAEQSKAIYFDNEGHVIHYDISVDASRTVATFLSTDPAPSPLFRLTYKAKKADELAITFEIAMNGKTDSLKTYLTGVVHRAKN
jgi:hypothetical protein